MRPVLHLLLFVWFTLASSPAFACSTCGEVLQGGGDIGDMCPASGAIYDALTACLCQGACASSCGDNACVSEEMTPGCLGCMDLSCGSQKAACLDDAVPDACPGQLDCLNGTCCPAEAEACGPEGTCIYPCPEGQYRCGETFCVDEGLVCCADVGHPELSCGAAHACTEDGGCKLATGCTGSCGSVDRDAVLPLWLAAAGAVTLRRAKRERR